MKVAFLSPFYPFRGGIAYFIELLAKEFTKKGIEVKIFNFINQYPNIIFPGKNQFDNSKKSYDFGIERVLTPYNPLTWHKAYKKIKEWNPDLLILKYWIPFFAPSFGYIVSKLKKNTKVKVFYIIDNIEFHEKWFLGDKLTKYALGKADLLITMSDAVYKDAKRLFPNNAVANAFHPIYKGYNKSRVNKESARDKLKIEKGHFTILFFGFIKKYKGVTNLIRAFHIFKNLVSESRLIIAGEVYGNDKEYIDLINELNLNASIIFHNKFIGDDEVEMYFKAADVLILPYIQATQSGILNIAYDMNLPVIVTPVGSLPDTIKKDGSGVVASSAEPNSISNALYQYYNSDWEIYRKNIEKVKEKYSWEKLVDFILEQTKKAAE